MFSGEIFKDFPHKTAVCLVKHIGYTVELPEQEYRQHLESLSPSDLMADQEHFRTRTRNSRIRIATGLAAVPTLALTLAAGITLRNANVNPDTVAIGIVSTLMTGFFAMLSGSENYKKSQGSLQMINQEIERRLNQPTNS